MMYLGFKGIANTAHSVRRQFSLHAYNVVWWCYYWLR